MRLLIARNVGTFKTRSQSFILVVNLASTFLLSLVGCAVVFFQAEDGIRDYKVTGVQTCALPISSISREALALRFAIGLLAAALLFSSQVALAQFSQQGPKLVGTGAVGSAVQGVSVRSEERRVGKECRSRWSPYH